MYQKILFSSIVFFIAMAANGQICQGNLGDPVVNINFGAGANPGPGIVGGGTSYGFSPFDCPNDGSYTIRNNTTSCFGNSWHSLLKDHTGNANGYFMLVNASFQPGDFYVDTIRGLCPNTTFEFAAWLLNVLLPSACGGNGIQPNITFKIESKTGVLLQSFNTGNLPTSISPIWKQYGFLFVTPAGTTDVVVRITNNAPGGCGNDLALDDITFRPCGPVVDATITGTGSGIIKDLCIGDNTPLIFKSIVSPGYSNPAYQWQQSIDGLNWIDVPGATNLSFTRLATGTGNYYYRLAVAEAGNINSPKCRVASNNLIVTVHDLPVTSATSNSPVCEGTTLSLIATGGTEYKWNGPNNYSGNGSPLDINNIKASAGGKYFVRVTSGVGCIKDDSALVIINPRPTADAGTDVNICEGGSTTLNGSGSISFIWSPSTGLSNVNTPFPLASPTDTIQYVLTVTDANGCKDDDTVAINVYKKPNANAGPDRTMIEGQAIQVNATASGTSVLYGWTPSIYIIDPTVLSPFINPPHDTTFILQVTSPFGCGIANDDVFIKVYKKVIIPNAFSPNSDGINDEWNIEALEAYPTSELIVFNRYGQAIYRSKGYNKKWKGTYNDKPLPIGTYYYIIDLNNELPKLTGWVMILR